ncbi:ubiquitin 3 binding protein But2 C-terminal domain-containing protein [Phaeosphaeriaceae sp. PMI808]|nr:ubiquitin 3 binding protein But2 C-terminal domain-containing protein [Phaeosphaeriaceae sp. PMI808]
MRLLAILATFFSFSIAASVLRPRSEQCPPIPQIAPTGQLPPGTLSPTFLLPISQKKPNKAFPGGQSAKVTPHDKCTLTRFDIPAAARNKTCSLVLFLGGCGEEEYEKGPGNIVFQGNLGVRYPVPGQTTWNNQPPLSPPFTDAPIIKLGTAYRLGGGPCDYKTGQPFASVGGSICSNDTTLSFTQSRGGPGKCPVGFHIIIS